MINCSYLKGCWTAVILAVTRGKDVFAGDTVAGSTSGTSPLTLRITASQIVVSVKIARLALSSTAFWTNCKYKRQNQISEQRKKKKRRFCIDSFQKIAPPSPLSHFKQLSIHLNRCKSLCCNYSAPRLASFVVLVEFRIPKKHFEESFGLCINSA